MTKQEELNRSINVSATISDDVYDYEKAYTKALNASNPKTNPVVEGKVALAANLRKDGLELVDAKYDSKSGMQRLLLRIHFYPRILDKERS